MTKADAAKTTNGHHALFGLLFLAAGAGLASVGCVASAEPDDAEAVVSEGDSVEPDHLIARDALKLVSVDSEEVDGENGAGVNAIDGKIDTFWHTAWKDVSPAPPHEIVLDLGATYDVEGFQYLPRQDGTTNGTIAVYRFLVSMDGSTWATAAQSRFRATTSRKTVTIANPVPGRFVKLVAESEINGGPWTSVAELSIFGVTPENPR